MRVCLAQGVLLGVLSREQESWRISPDLGPQRSQQIPEGAAILYADNSTCTGGVVRNRELEGGLLPRGLGKMVPYGAFPLQPGARFKRTVTSAARFWLRFHLA